MTPAEQLANVRAVSDPFRRIMVKQVTGGYALSGVEQLQAKDGQGVLAELNCEGAAFDPADAVRMVNNFLFNGTFDDPIIDHDNNEDQPELFEAMGNSAPVPPITEADEPVPVQQTVI